MKIRVIILNTTETEQTWEVPDDTDIGEVLDVGLPADAELISETTVLDSYGENIEVEVIEE